MPGRPSFPSASLETASSSQPHSSFHPPPACDFLFIFGSVLRKCWRGECLCPLKAAPGAVEGTDAQDTVLPYRLRRAERCDATEPPLLVLCCQFKHCRAEERTLSL